MVSATELIDSVLEGESVEAVVESCVNEARERGTARRPRMQRFKGRSAAVSSVTGKRKDPRRRMLARRAARKGRAKRSMAAKKFARSSAGKRLHKMIGAGKLRR